MPITYSQAGVDIDRGDALVERIKKLARPTRIPEVVADVGGFAGLCALPSGLVDPILVSGTDGVGTKLKVAFAANVHDTVGQDLVAMCVNDVITVGARPLFFLDYFATGTLELDVGEAVVRGIAEGCKLAGCALLGGETAELPGMYAPGEYDLAGFAVGVVERAKMLDGTKARAGDVVLGVASSGLHSNGYSLARKVLFERMGLGIHDQVPGLGRTAAEALLVPTRIYARAVRELLAALPEAVRGLSHITGGGLPGNLPRVLPEGLGARLDLSAYERPAIFRVIAEQGPVEEAEMRRTFNLGVGLVVVVAPEAEAAALGALRGAGEQAFRLGEVIEVGADVPFEDRVQFDR
ncbi:phosphoribosylformylglycinamidine cyclo-ligase [Polyangium jinanense]|uniref:Phosphoribosylformylglycinamidine cyclo-ligase n=1 Tax=Polyangium jinanense TaxID=2829994 RepID=A0A9X4AQN1_9BACT|nr:phosphoribosylformylglycinamidine cyclo-ligase [Polyangium jinanense]MDC3953629.1 phosphoribosylformylglycinamidine cyclo-ligase [Polyangium jinanense]MDC3979250.1 phosphoribosylformylglycinamidine cyclo-ligase [Polyangium jinanense]